ncbi:hypothetical protein J6590_022278 [Homalodisca vitripennis]|nr:hypothetical protein J6590_022278 [Homalodisca vitripennis]
MNVSPLYKAVWFWKDKGLSYIAVGVKEKGSAKQTTNKRASISENVGERAVKFLENVDQNQQKIFKLRYQRPMRQGVPYIITLQDVKDVVTFLLMGNLPRAVLSLLHSYEINYLIRALILYMQLYLQIHEDLRYRKLSYATQRLKHPISSVRETLCKKHLSKLRCRIGQEYALIIAGEGFYKKYHHMNNPLNQSYVAKDIQLNEYMSKLLARIVWVALYRTNYKEIEVEIARLFHFKNINGKVRRHNLPSFKFENNHQILQGNPLRFSSHWHMLSPVISDIFINDDDPDLLLSKNTNSTDFVATEICGLEAALILPEELLARFDIVVGILGLPRENFETMLHLKQQRQKSLLEEELELAQAIKETLVEKPMVKMYEYIWQLERSIDLSVKVSKEDTKNVREEIQFYLSNHVTDSKNAFNLWKSSKLEPIKILN